MEKRDALLTHLQSKHIFVPFIILFRYIVKKAYADSRYKGMRTSVTNQVKKLLHAGIPN
jgi:hypothetical protein